MLISEHEFHGFVEHFIDKRGPKTPNLLQTLPSMQYSMKMMTLTTICDFFSGFRPWI